MPIALDKLRFDPDPLGFNNAAQCSCMYCVARRALAEKLGVPPEAIVGMQIAPLQLDGNVLKVSALGAETQPVYFSLPTPAEVAQSTPAPVALPFQIKAFDTNRDGTPHIPKSQPPSPSAPAPTESVRKIGIVQSIVAAFRAATQSLKRWVKDQPHLRVIGD